MLDLTNILAYEDTVLLQLSETSLKEQHWSVWEIEEGLDALEQLLPSIRNGSTVSFSFIEQSVLKHLDIMIKKYSNFNPQNS